MTLYTAQNYWLTCRAARQPDSLTEQHLFYARTFGETWITDIIAEGHGVLQRRAVEFAREAGYVVPVGMRG